MLLINGEVFTGKTFADGLRVRLADGEVRETGMDLKAAEGEEVLDLEGDFLLPGFVDVHIHAFRGQDVMSGGEAVRGMSRDLFRLGVAAFCPTTMSAGEEETRLAVRGIRDAMKNPEPGAARVLGVHLEAPFLSNRRAGAQKTEYFRDPDMRWLTDVTEEDPGCVRLITLAPELDGSAAFIRAAVKAGIHISVGHSDADAETVHRAAEDGADHITHLFNAQTPLLHRAPGVPGAALSDDRFFCEMICDGIHLHRDIVRIAVRCKGRKAVAITDAMEGAGFPDGAYRLGGQKVLVRDGAARLENGTLAGSVLTMPRALENLIHLFGIDPETACAMCTSSPAASIGEPVLGTMASGSPAPLTRWDRAWRMKGIIC